MSDRETQIGNTNEGITLPEGTGATYNAGLSPLFYGRSGFSRTDPYMLETRGVTASLWASTSMHGTFSHRLEIGNNNFRVYPSRRDTWRAYGFSLRCLVSTNNG